MNTLELLRSVETLDAISDADLSILQDAFVVKTFRKNEKIFDYGDFGDTMFVVQSGVVHIHLPGAREMEAPLKVIQPGDFFGELSLFDAKPRTASAAAASDVVLLELQQSVLERFLEQRPRVAIAMLRAISARLRETTTLLTARAAKNVNEEFERALSWSDRFADMVAEWNGSWRFIVLILAVTVAWCLVNSSLLVASPLDPYPYQFFNLALAILVGLQGPLIVMSQNRLARKDRARVDSDFRVNLKNEINIESLIGDLRHLSKDVRRLLFRLEPRDPGQRDGG